MSSNNTEDLTEQEVTEADFQKALRELAKGERTATALENQLNVMEAKIEALLAQAEQEQEERQNTAKSSSGSNAEESAK